MADQFAQNFATGAPEQTQLKPTAPTQVALEPELDSPEMAVTREFIRDQEAASDEELLQAQQMAEDPEVVNRIVEQARRDAESGEGTFNLTNTEKLVLGAAAIAPLIGGLIGGDEGALAGVGAFGSGLAAFGKAEIEAEKTKSKERIATGRIASEKAKIAALQEKERIENLKDLRKVMREGKIKSVEKFKDMLQKAKQLSSALAQGSGMGDTAAIISLMKILDPGSVVRPSEFKSVEEAQDLKDRATVLLEKFGTARILGPKARQEIKQLAKESVLFMADQVSKDIARLRETARLVNVVPDNVVREDFGAADFLEFESFIDSIPISSKSPDRSSAPTGARALGTGDTINLQTRGGMKLKKGKDGKFRPVR